MSGVFVQILQMSASASLLILAILLVRLLLRRVPKQMLCILWILAAIRLVCPLYVSSPLSLQNPFWRQWTEAAAAAEIFQSAVTADRGIPDAIPEETMAAIQIPEDFYTAQVSTPPLSGTEVPIVDAVQNGESTEGVSASPWYIGSIVWLCGTAGMLLYALVSYAGLRRRTAVSMPFGGDVLLCDTIDTPFILGFLPPKIYVPSSLMDGDFCPVLAHERAHISRGDPFWKMLGYLILAVHWFNPLVWLAYHLLCRDIEAACDARVIRSLCMEERRAYSEALLACSIRQKRHGGVLSCPLAFGELGVRERIRAVLDYRRPGVLTVLAAAVTCAVLAVCFLTDPLPDTTAILRQENGYRVLRSETAQTLYFSVPTEVFSGEQDLSDGITYEVGEVVVYENAPTVLSLTKIMPTASDPEQYWMFFTFTYDALPGSGIITTLGRPEYSADGTHIWYAMPSLNADPHDAVQTYADSAYCGAQEEGNTFGIVIDRAVLASAQSYIAFSVTGFSDTVYTRGLPNAADGILCSAGGTVGYDSTVWFDSYMDASDGEVDRALMLDAFPGVTFYADSMAVSAEEGGVRTTLIDGMPVWNVFLYDLTGDGRPELCATVSFGSGIVDEHIVVYDYALHRTYTLWERGVYDFRLEQEDHVLYAVMSAYNGEMLSRQPLCLADTGDGMMALSMGGGDTLSWLKTADYLVPERCIYMSLLSSYAAIGGDSGYRYLYDSERNVFCSINRTSGSISMMGSLLGGWSAFPWTDEEWASMAPVYRGNGIDRISEQYTEMQYLSLGENDCLLQMDDALWLVHFSKNPDGSPYVWSIYALVPEEEKGSAVWSYSPTLSSRMPYFEITFAVDGITSVSAFCAESRLVDSEGSADNSWRADTPELTMRWLPTTAENSIGSVDCAKITFTAQGENDRYLAGTLYLTKNTEASDALHTYYTASLVGYGLHLSQSDDGWGAVITIEE